MALPTGSFWSFGLEDQEKIKTLCQRINHEKSESGKLWYNLCIKTDDAVMKDVTVNKDEYSIENTITNILEQISKQQISDGFGLEHKQIVDVEFKKKLRCAISEKLSNTDVCCLYQAIGTWTEGPIMVFVVQDVLSHKIRAHELPLCYIKSLTQRHSKHVEEILKSIFNEWDESESFADLFSDLCEDSRHSLCLYFFAQPLNEQVLPILQRLLPHIPITALASIANGLHMSSSTLSNSLPFARFLLQLTILYSSSMTEDVHQTMLRVCSNNQTLLKRQIERNLEKK